MQLVWTEIWAYWRWLTCSQNKKIEKMTKRSSKTNMLQIRIIIRKFRMIVRNGPEEENRLQAKEDA